MDLIAQLEAEQVAALGANIPDFKAVNRIIAGELNDPAAIPEDGEFEEAAVGAKLAAIDVDGVAQRLEGVEGDAHRQDDVEQSRLKG